VGVATDGRRRRAWRGTSGWLAAALIAAGVASVTAGTSTAQLTAGPPNDGHYEYVFPDGGLYVYDMDHNQQLVQQVTDLPDTDGVRGVMFSPTTGILYISHGSDQTGGPGHLLAYDLATNSVLWNRTYSFGIDSGAITPDGKTIYMPTGENDPSGIWNVLNASDGTPIGTVQGGSGAHNTVVSLDGKYAYLAGRDASYLTVVDTATNEVLRQIGPLKRGIRPFTVNGTNTLAFTTATGVLGFQVSSITTGKVLYTVPIPGFSLPSGFPISAPSHGITLTPDEKQAWVFDAANDYVHVFDLTGLPASPPELVANIQLSSIAGNESPCAYDCTRDGWLQTSRDGRFVYVGDSGDVIDTKTYKLVATLPMLTETRKMLEIDWSGGVPVFTTTRQGLGYVTTLSGPPPSPPPPPTPPGRRTPAPVKSMTQSTRCQARSGSISCSDVITIGLPSALTAHTSRSTACSGTVQVTYRIGTGRRRHTAATSTSHLNSRCLAKSTARFAGQRRTRVHMSARFSGNRYLKPKTTSTSRRAR
jgi:DNA-binding beta-propeller fold protein YncE